MGQFAESTDSWESELAIYQKKGEEFIQMELPKPDLKDVIDDKYFVGFNVKVLEVLDSTVKVGIPELNLETEFMIDGEQMTSLSWRKEISLEELYRYLSNEKATIGSYAWAAQVVGEKEKKDLELRIVIDADYRVDRRDVVVTLRYQDNVWKAIDMRVEELKDYFFWCGTEE